MPVGLRTKSMADETPCVGEDARVVPGARAEQRRVGQDAAQPARRGRRRRSVVGVHDSGVVVAPRRLGLRRTRPSTAACTTWVAAAPGVEPGRDVARDGVDPAGDDVDLAHGGDAAEPPRHTTGWRARRRRYSSIASRRSSMRVVPAWLASPGRSTRHRPCGQMSVPTATARDGSLRSSLPSGASASALPCSTCSLTKRPMRPYGVGVGALGESGSRPARAPGLGHRHAVDIGEGPGPGRRRGHR